MKTKITNIKEIIDTKEIHLKKNIKHINKPIKHTNTIYFLLIILLKTAFK